jgi:hypothetical protein
MLGDRRPADGQPFGQLPHSLRFLRQARDDGQARPIGQRIPAVNISVSIH